jgi:hypothetical protein
VVRVHFSVDCSARSHSNAHHACLCHYSYYLLYTTAVPAAAAAVAEQPLQPLVPGTGSVLGDILAGAAISAGALVPLAAVAGCAQIARGAQETALAEVTV